MQLFNITQNIGFLAICCGLNYGLGKLIYILVSYKYQKFNEIVLSKRLYIVKNLTKSLVLLSIIYKIMRIVMYIYNNTPNINNDIKIIASIYVSNDIVGLLTVPNLPNTTVKHHITTTCLLFINYLIDYDEMSRTSTKIGVLLVGYSTFSALSFFVNFYLGARYIVKNKLLIDNIRQVAYINYGVCIFFNWLSQLMFMAYTISIDYYLVFPYSLYCVFLIPIIKDDLILMSWLKK